MHDYTRAVQVKPRLGQGDMVAVKGDMGITVAVTESVAESVAVDRGRGGSRGAQAASPACFAGDPPAFSVTVGFRLQLEPPARPEGPSRSSRRLRPDARVRVR